MRLSHRPAPLLLTLLLPAALLLSRGAPRAEADDPPLGRWTKLSPLENSPASPRLGYEGACVWDPLRRVMIRYGGHNQGGGGEQGSEIWLFDPRTAQWELRLPNLAPPGICCGQQNLFEPLSGRYLRFPAFSGSHGWQWFREIYLNDSTAWTYDPGENRWRNLRPFPTPRVHPLRAASWDAEHQVAVLFGGEGSREGTVVYDPHTNGWTRMHPPEEPEGRSGGNLAYHAPSGLHVLFGAQFQNDPHTWTYDLAANRWLRRELEQLPNTDRNDAVLTYDPHSGKVVAVVKGSPGEEGKPLPTLETWTFDLTTDRWERLDTPLDASGNRARQLMAAPELGGVLLENVTKPVEGLPREQQVLLLRLAEPRRAPSPDPPGDLRVETGPREAVLHWSPVEGAARYTIERAEGEIPWRLANRRAFEVAGDPTRWTDSELTPGTLYHYRLTAHDPAGNAGEPSRRIRAQPRLVDGLVVSVLGENRAELTWSRGEEADLAGWLVERAEVQVYSEDQLRRLKSQTPPLDPPSVGAIGRVGPFTPLTPEPLREPRFLDTTLNLAKPFTLSEEEAVYSRNFSGDSFDPEGKPYPRGVYAYRVRGVNRLGVAGGPSAATWTLPSSPQWFFSREAEGGACELKWEANPEQQLQGYRVYRMDGRFSSAPIRRLTPEPISATTFRDPEAGSGTRRYYVVAVDALGQEGTPSAPVWSNREWQSFYEPFTEDWHQ